MTYQRAEGAADPRLAAVDARLAEFGVEPGDGDVVIPRDLAQGDFSGACDHLGNAIDDLLGLSEATNDPATAQAFAQAAFLLSLPYEQQCVLVPKPLEGTGGGIVTE
jgi:hypothetical protein